jgi:hypothetical protein
MTNTQCSITNIQFSVGNWLTNELLTSELMNQLCVLCAIFSAYSALNGDSIDALQQLTDLNN